MYSYVHVYTEFISHCIPSHVLSGLTQARGKADQPVGIDCPNSVTRKAINLLNG